MTMDYQAFIEAVREAAHVDDDEAGRAACATLTTLSERITAGETEDMAERLPPELGSCLRPTPRPEPFHLDTFVERLAMRARVDQSSAERDAKAVFAALWTALGPDEFHDIRSQLPRDFHPLLDDAISIAPGHEDPAQRPVDQLYRAVARRSRTLDARSAPDGVEAVLEALAVRISQGQAEDLAAQLPAQLRPAIERGLARKGREHAIPLKLDQFLDEIAALEGVDRDRARDHARAVLLTLKETVAEKEWKDTWSQLPDEYRRLLRD
jgi:uncharacterized protein (DUF2267 family)